jgi:UDP-N-acetyl-D-glucosamine dehydrogenase
VNTTSIDWSAPASSDLLLERITRREAVVAIVGLGYVGLPLAEAFAQAGFTVLGFDTDLGRVASLRAGQSYLGHFATDRVGTLRAGGRFEPTADPGALGGADVLVICVPTPLTPTCEPDLSAVVTAGQAIAASSRPGRLVVLESTTYPGTTRQVLLPLLERPDLVLGENLFVAFSPEREDPGNVAFSTRRIPRLVGGLDEKSGVLATAFYRQALEQVIPVRNAEVAEASKILENTYRAVNIALVNELKMLYDRLGIDIWEVIEAAKTKPFGFQPFYPGPGWGGHCIPIDPYYLAWVGRRVGQPAKFVELAGEINRQMPHFVLGKLVEALNDDGRPVKGSRVLLVGMAYKRDVDDIRESPGLELLALLERQGAMVAYHDPHVPVLVRDLAGTDQSTNSTLASVPMTAEVLAAQDAVLIVTDHTACDWKLIAAQARLVLDTRNALRGVPEPRARIVRA